MPKEKDSLKLKIYVNAPVSEVYSAFTNATALCEWLCNVAQADARKLGRLYLWWNNGYYASGEFISLKPNQRVVFTWHGREEPGITRVKVSFKPDAGGTWVRLSHSGLSGDKTWNPVRRAFKRGWKVGLENLRSVLETGLDLRFIRLPLLGISGISELKPEGAETTDEASQSGLKIEGIIPGLGAQAAGLQAGDVLVKVDGNAVGHFSDLVSVLKKHRAGDVIKVTCYRDGVKRSLKLTLSQRPIPEIPPVVDDLAEAVESAYAQADQELAACLKLVSKAEAGYKPAADSWNAKENLAHLIANERDTHAWIAGLIEGQEADFIYHANFDLRIQAIVSAFPSVEGLLQEFRRNQKETIALVKTLPAEFVARKRSYWRLGYNLLEMPVHVREHCEIIHDLLAAARLQAEPG